MPVTFAVLTNIAAFMPLFFVPGASGNIFRQIPAVVVSVFAISLVESLFILPAHLAHGRESGRLMHLLGAPNRAVAGLFDRFSERVYAPLVDFAAHQRYFVPAAASRLLLVTAGVVGGGLIRTSFLPRWTPTWPRPPRGSPWACPSSPRARSAQLSRRPRAATEDPLAAT